MPIPLRLQLRLAVVLCRLRHAFAVAVTAGPWPSTSQRRELHLDGKAKFLVASPAADLQKQPVLLNLKGGHARESANVS